VHVLFSGLAVASVNALHVWALPLLFGFDMMQVGIVFLILIPRSKKNAFADWAPWLRKLVADDQKRMEKPFWRFVRNGGPVFLAVVSAFISGGLLAAVVIRTMALSEHKSWSYAFLAHLVADVVKVLFYLGAISAILRPIFPGIFH
jgi:hypothetical protein